MINTTMARRSAVCMGRVCYGPSLSGPTLLWAEIAMGRVCYLAEISSYPWELGYSDSDVITLAVFSMTFYPSVCRIPLICKKKWLNFTKKYILYKENRKRLKFK